MDGYRSHPLMFSKIGIAISTTAGKVTKDISQHFFYLVNLFIFRLAFSIQAMSWEDVSAAKKVHICRNQ